MKKTYTTKIDSETMALGQQLAQECGDSCIIYLTGELGAGKTTLVRGFLRAFGYQGPVKSPTFTIVESYQIANKQIYHFDLYRVTNPEELEYIGIRDYFIDKAIHLIEWPEKGANILPPANITCNIKIINSTREICIQLT